MAMDMRRTGRVRDLPVGWDSPVSLCLTRSLSFVSECQSSWSSWSRQSLGESRLNRSNREGGRERTFLGHGELVDQKTGMEEK